MKENYKCFIFYSSDKRRNQRGRHRGWRVFGSPSTKANAGREMRTEIASRKKSRQGLQSPGAGSQHQRRIVKSARHSRLRTG